MRGKGLDVLFFALIILLELVGLWGLTWFICDYVNGMPQ